MTNSETTWTSETEAAIEIVEQMSDDDREQIRRGSASGWIAGIGQMPGTEGLDVREICTEIERIIDGDDQARAERIEYVVATGIDADEWSRHATLAEARAEAEQQGPGTSIWTAESYDSVGGADPGPIETL